MPNGGAGWMMTRPSVSLAISLLACAPSVVRHVRTKPGYLGLLILAFGACGFLLAAVFKTDPITTAADAYTFAGRMHVLGASLDYSPVGLREALTTASTGPSCMGHRPISWSVR